MSKIKYLKIENPCNNCFKDVLTVPTIGFLKLHKYFGKTQVKPVSSNTSLGYGFGFLSDTRLC